MTLYEDAFSHKSKPRRHVELIIDYLVDGAPNFDYNDNTGVIVRCRDCKHWNQKESYIRNCGRCDKHKLWQGVKVRVCMPPDGYCSFGERKDEENE